jgi:hypothetical protein
MNQGHWSVAVSPLRDYLRRLMPNSPSLLRFASAAVIAVAVLGAASGSALAAYPPTKPPPRATCSISTIVEHRVAVSCVAGKVRAGKSCSLVIKKSVVARGRVDKNGRYFARFAVKTLLTRGTRIVFVVQGATAATIRV